MVGKDGNERIERKKGRKEKRKERVSQLARELEVSRKESKLGKVVSRNREQRIMEKNELKDLPCKHLAEAMEAFLASR